MSRRATLYVLSLFMLVMSQGCGARPPLASNKSVDIGQTPVKGQGESGFCWAYATTGFFEAMLLKKTGVALDLSPEALGFYRIADELYALSQRFPADELRTGAQVRAKSFEDLEGWDLIFQPSYTPGYQAPGAFELARRHGVVPETVWSFKFTSKNKNKTLFNAVFTNFAALMQAHGQNQVTRAMILDMLAAKDVFGSRPPTEFSLDTAISGRRDWSATDFVAEAIGFKPEAFTYMIPDAGVGYSQLATATKETLARGLDVPLGFTIYGDEPDAGDGSFSGHRSHHGGDAKDNGHVVLVTDFVNNGSSPGDIGDKALAEEVAKSPAELAYVVLKNSWGTRTHSPHLPHAGYYTMDRAYLEILAGRREDMTLIVPTDIAARARQVR